MTGLYERELPTCESVGGNARPSASAATVVVTDRRLEADGVASLGLAAPDGRRLPDWAPGAHVDLVLPNGLTRQYSLCGDRFDAHSYRLGILREPQSRGGSAYVHDEVEVGSVLGLGGPRNNFPLVPADRYLFVAGGIGITPILPMIRQAEMLGADWQLLYGGRSRASMAFADELSAYGDRVQMRPQDEYGLLDLIGFLGEPDPAARVYACGPAPLLSALAKVTEQWPPHTVWTERFVAKEVDAPEQESEFEVELARRGLTVTVTLDQSVLDAVASAGVDVLSSCRQGTCGTCEVTVLSGEPDHRDSVLNDEQRAANDCMFICVSRARCPRLVLDL